MRNDQSRRRAPAQSFQRRTGLLREPGRWRTSGKFREMLSGCAGAGVLQDRHGSHASRQHASGKRVAEQINSCWRRSARRLANGLAAQTEAQETNPYEISPHVHPSLSLSGEREGKPCLENTFPSLIYRFAWDVPARKNSRNWNTWSKRRLPLHLEKTVCEFRHGAEEICTKSENLRKSASSC